jgi:hypothetical protein
MKLMLQHDPAQRPTADAILQSHLMPPRSEIEVAYLEEAVKVSIHVYTVRFSALSFWNYSRAFRSHMALSSQDYCPSCSNKQPESNLI